MIAALEEAAFLGQEQVDILVKSVPELKDILVHKLSEQVEVLRQELTNPREPTAYDLTVQVLPRLVGIELPNLKPLRKPSEMPSLRQVDEVYHGDQDTIESTFPAAQKRFLIRFLANPWLQKQLLAVSWHGWSCDEHRSCLYRRIPTPRSKGQTKLLHVLLGFRLKHIKLSGQPDTQHREDRSLSTEHES